LGVLGKEERKASIRRQPPNQNEWVCGNGGARAAPDIAGDRSKGSVSGGRS